MLSYADAPVPILAGFAESHQRFWDRLARPGTGWTRAERVTTPREARAAARRAQCCERRSALSPRIVADPHTTVTDLLDVQLLPSSLQLLVSFKGTPPLPQNSFKVLQRPFCHQNFDL